MNTKKIVAVLLAMLMIAGQVFANGNSDTTEPVDGTGGQVTLDMINHVDLTAPEGKTWEAVKRAFLAQNPNVVLEEEILYGDAYHQKLAARAASGDLPDVMYLWPGARSGELLGNGLVEDLTPYITDDIRAQYADSAFAPQWGGAIYEVPMALTCTSVMYVNKAVLAEAGLDMPKTYEDLVAMVEPLKAMDKDVIVMPNQSGWVMNSCLFGTIVGRIAGPDFIEKAVAGEKKFTDQAFVDSLAFLDTIYKDGVIPPTSLQLAYGQGPADFGNGGAPFMIDGDWRVGAIIPIFSDDQQTNDIELTIFPEIPGEKYPKVTSMVGATGLGMRAGIDGVKKDMALKLIFFFSGEEAARIRLFSEGIFPAFKLDMDMYAASLSPLALKRAQIYRTYPAAAVVDNYLPAEPNDALNNGMQEIGLGKSSPEAVAEAVEAAIER